MGHLLKIKCVHSSALYHLYAFNINWGDQRSNPYILYGRWKGNFWAEKPTFRPEKPVFYPEKYAFHLIKYLSILQTVYTARIFKLLRSPRIDSASLCTGRLSPNFLTFKEPENRFQEINSASLCSLAGQYGNPIPTRFLAPIDCVPRRLYFPALQ